MASIFAHDNVRVMTYNIKNGGDIPHWEKRKAALAETIRQAKPTILGTQEGFEYQLAYLRDELKHYDMYGEGRDPFIGGEYCAVFVDNRVTQVHDSGTFWLSDTPTVAGSKMGDEHLPRIATWVKMTVHGTPLLYINTHLTYLEDGIPAQMKVLVAEIEKLIDPATETVITGDFNVGRHRDPIAMLNEIGFADAWTLSENFSGPMFTFPDFKPWDDETVAAVVEENRIDWVCVRPAEGETTPGLDVDTIHTHRIDPVPSDHFPVVVSGH